MLYLVKNFKSIRNMYIKEIENALILVGKNNTGKTAVLAGFAGAKIAENSDKNDNAERKSASHGDWRISLSLSKGMRVKCGNRESPIALTL